MAAAAPEVERSTNTRIAWPSRTPFVPVTTSSTTCGVGKLASTIGVAATLATTLNPTTRLLQAKAQAAGRAIDIRPLLIDSAYEKLMQGDREGHDSLLVDALSELARSVEVVVLAQASMARVLPRLPEAERSKCLSSPRLGMERVRQTLAAAAPRS